MDNQMTTPTPTPTPETEAEVARIVKEGGYGDDFQQLEVFAVKLERERDAARAELQRHREIALSCGKSTVEGLKESLLHEMRLNNQKDLPVGFDSWSAYHESIIKLRAELAKAREDYSAELLDSLKKHLVVAVSVGEFQEAADIDYVVDLLKGLLMPYRVNFRAAIDSARKGGAK